MEDEQFAFTDLSEQLQGQDRDRVARQALERLRNLQALVARQASEGAPPEEYERLRVLFDALASAERVMVSFVPLRDEDAQSVDV